MVSLKSAVRVLSESAILLHLTLHPRLQYERITLSKMTLAFFLFSFAHCFAHGIIRSFLFTLDADTSTLVTDITTTAGVPPREIASLTGNSKEFQIKLCTSIPIGPPTNSCTVIFDSLQTNFSNPIPPGFRRSVRVGAFLFQVLLTNTLKGGRRRCMSVSFDDEDID